VVFRGSDNQVAYLEFICVGARVNLEFLPKPGVQLYKLVLYKLVSSQPNSQI
jgi:hypothetical protein